MIRGFARRRWLRYGVLAGVAGAWVGLAGCSTPPRNEEAKRPAELRTSRLLVGLPDYCNTPDGMCLLPDRSIVVSIPNFNDAKVPPLLMRIAADNKAEPFYQLPTPYPGLPDGLNRIGPMGIASAPSGDLYLADLQSMDKTIQNSRLWRLAVKDGRVERMVLVASGFNVSNGVTVHNEYVYVTESVLEKDSHPLTSAVMRFKLGEENVKLKTPLKDDPHIIATFKSCKDKWRFGADGIAFDSKGNLFVGLFGEGVLYKIEFDKDGKVASNRAFAKSPVMLSCDGMSVDLRTDLLYMADSVANAVQVIHPDGRVETLAQNGDVTDKRTGQLDQPCEALVRGDEIIVSNMDWPFPDFRNAKHQMPATLSVIKLKE